jgi:sugar lactone lactonase YvrE
MAALRVFTFSALLSLYAVGGHSQPTFTISTVAGNGKTGYSGDGGPATSATLDNPLGVAVDPSGNVYIADFYNNVIRKVAANGIITTYAGTGAYGDSGDGGPATKAALSEPGSVLVDAAGNLYIGDYGNRVRKVAPNGTITTVAGNGSEGVSGDGGPATSAAVGSPNHFAMDTAGNLFVSCSAAPGDGSGPSVIRKVTPSGLITTVAGNGTLGYSGDGGPATNAALDRPRGLAIDTAGNLFFADQGNNRIRRISNGIITTVAGTGVAGYAGDKGPAISAELNSPTGIALDAIGNLYIADAGNNRVRALLTDGTINTIAGNGTPESSGDQGPATSASLISWGIAISSSGAIYVSGGGTTETVRLLTPTQPNVPNITPNGIVPIYSLSNTIQPGSWISIYGSNLASGIATWNGNFPTSLGGTTVTINNKPAYLWYVSPSQINLQAPDDTATGIVNVVVTTLSGASTSTVTLGQFGPSFNLLDGKHVAGIILRSDGSGAYGGGAYDIVGDSNPAYHLNGGL